MGTFDHSFTLQAVMEMKKDLGILVERIDRMREDVAGSASKIDTVATKVDSINTKLAWLSGISVGITGIVLMVWAIVTNVPWDKMIPDQPAKPAAQTVAAKPSPPTQ